MKTMTVASTQNDIIKQARAKIAEDLKLRAQAQGNGHGVVVGAYTKEALTATAHQGNKAVKAVQGYSTGFFFGFRAGWCA